MISLFSLYQYIDEFWFDKELCFYVNSLFPWKELVNTFHFKCNNKNQIKQRRKMKKKQILFKFHVKYVVAWMMELARKLVSYILLSSPKTHKLMKWTVCIEKFKATSFTRRMSNNSISMIAFIFLPVRQVF